MKLKDSDCFIQSVDAYTHRQAGVLKKNSKLRKLNSLPARPRPGGCRAVTGSACEMCSEQVNLEGASKAKITRYHSALPENTEAGGQTAHTSALCSNSESHPTSREIFTVFLFPGTLNMHQH